jgi:hypothetical protein
MAGSDGHGLLRGIGGGATVPAASDAPPDGDFARLLEAASLPTAHRMDVDPTLAALVTPDTRVFGTARRPVWGSPGMVREQPAAPDRPPTRPSGARGRAGAEASGPDGTAAPRAARVHWSERPLRDRVVQGLFALAILWILGGFVSALLESPGNALGGLLVLGAAAFIVLRAWARRRPRTPPSP